MTSSLKTCPTPAQIKAELIGTLESVASKVDGLVYCNGCLYDHNSIRVQYEILKSEWASSLGNRLESDPILDRGSFGFIYEQVEASAQEAQEGYVTASVELDDGLGGVAVTVLLYPLFYTEETHIPPIKGDILLLKKADQSFSDAEIAFAALGAKQWRMRLEQICLLERLAAQRLEVHYQQWIINRFVQSIPTELRSVAFKLNLAIVLAALRIDHEHHQDHLQIARELSQLSVSHIGKLTLLEAAQAEMTRNTTLDFFSIIQEAIAPIQDRATATGKLLWFSAPKKEAPIIAISPVRLHLLVQAITQNLCEYTPSGEVIILTAKINRLASRLEIVFDSSLISIPQSLQIKLLHIDGLSLISIWVEQCNSSISLRSVGKATQIHLFIPLFEQDASAGV